MELDIVTITYNSERHLHRCLESVRSCRKVIKNFIIIDGRSQDGTIEIIKSFADIVSEFISEPDSGISDAFNKGIARCSAKFILLLNSDDWLIEGKLEDIIGRDVGDEKIICTRMLSYSQGRYLGSFNSMPSLIPVYNSMLHPGCIISADVYRHIGLYDLALKTAMDYDFFCRCFYSGIPFRVLDIPLVAFQEGGTSRARKYMILLESYALRRKYHGALLPLHEVKQLISRIIGDTLDYFGLKEVVKKWIVKR